MDNHKVPNCSEGMMRIRKLSSYKGKDCYSDLINRINSMRAKYQWSEKIYDEANTENVYLISSNDTNFGFIECTYKDLDIPTDTPPTIFLHEIHIAPSMHNKGVGKSVLKHLLRKGICLEMIVANENESMLALVGKFNDEHKDITQNTRTVVLRP